MKKYLFLLLAVSTTLSCSKGDSDSEDLKVTFDNSKAYLIEASASSCVASQATGTTIAKDITPFYFVIQNPVLAWSNTTKTLSVSMVRISFKNGLVSYSKTVGTDELAAVFGTDVTHPWNGTILPGLSVTSMPLCRNLYFGGVSVPEDSSFTVIATLEIVGFSIDPASGDQFPISSKTTIPIVKLK